MLVVFAHGWHHACRTCDRDLVCFRKVLSQISGAESKSKKRNVIGVFLAWRGRLFHPGATDYLSVWNRKNAAEHIGISGGKEVLSRLHGFWADQFEPNGSPRVLMITVGHSFGGAAVLSAVHGRMLGDIDDIVHAGGTGVYPIVRAQEQRRDQKTKAIRSRFGDLVVLVNPAIEAARYTPFDRDLFDRRFRGASRDDLIRAEMPLDKRLPYAAKQLPVMLTVASTADWPNGRAFPSRAGSAR